MSITQFVRKNIFNLIVLYIIISACFIAGLFTLFLYGGDVVNENWVDYRCNPLIMPFASYFGHSTSDNFNKCLGFIFKHHSKQTTGPFHDMFEGAFGTIGKVLPVFNKIRMFATKLRALFLSIATSIFERIEDVGELIHYVFVKLIDIMRKMQGVFTITLKTLLTVQKTFESMWNGPIGKVSRFLCFDPKTPVLMNNGTWKYIKNIRLNDNLKNNNKVLGVIEGDAGNNTFYNYRGIIVSGTHLVKENGSFIRVESSNEAVKTKNPGKIYCLVTEQNLIHCKDCEFADFIEYSDKELNSTIKNIVLNKLNNNTTSKNHDINKNYIFGFSGHSKIKMLNDMTKYIKDIKIGDETMNGKVIGLVKQQTEGNLYTDGQNIFSGDNIVYNNNTYSLVKYMNHLKEYNGNINTLYHIITNNGRITLDNGVIMTDYLECDDEETNEYIDRLVKNMLN